MYSHYTAMTCMAKINQSRVMRLVNECVVLSGTMCLDRDPLIPKVHSALSVPAKCLRLVPVLPKWLDRR
jgi:hypothetical protein